MRDKVLAAIEIYGAGGTIERALKQAGVSNTPFRRLLREDAEIMEKYEAAIKSRAYGHYDEAYGVADAIGTESGLNAQDARTKADILMRLGSRLHPDRFGDKVAVQHEVKPSLLGAIEAGRARALRPPHDPANVIEAQFVDVTNACDAGASDKQSDAVLIAAAPDMDDPFAP